jgi:hypothetical protein
MVREIPFSGTKLVSISSCSAVRRHGSTRTPAASFSFFGRALTPATRWSYLMALATLACPLGQSERPSIHVFKPSMMRRRNWFLSSFGALGPTELCLLNSFVSLVDRSTRLWVILGGCTPQQILINQWSSRGLRTEQGPKNGFFFASATPFGKFEPYSEVPLDLVPYCRFSAILEDSRPLQ